MPRVRTTVSNIGVDQNDFARSSQTAWRLARLDDECPESARDCVWLCELLLLRPLCLRSLSPPDSSPAETGLVPRREVRSSPTGVWWPLLPARSVLTWLCELLWLPRWPPRSFSRICLSNSPCSSCLLRMTSSHFSRPSTECAACAARSLARDVCAARGCIFLSTSACVSPFTLAASSALPTALVPLEGAGSTAGPGKPVPAPAPPLRRAGP